MSTQPKLSCTTGYDVLPSSNLVFYSDYYSNIVLMHYSKEQDLSHTHNNSEQLYTQSDI